MDSSASPPPVLLVMGLLLVAAAAAVLKYIWPVALFLVGLHLMFRAFGSRQST